MATYKPELHNIDAVMSYFDNYDDPGYQVYAGHKPDPHFCRFTYSGNDKNVGREKLLEALQSVISNPDNTNTYLLQITAQKGKKHEPINSITFQLNKPQSFYPAHNMQVHGISEIVGKLSAIEQRISMIENDDDDDDDDDPENELGALGTLFASPEIKSMLMQGLMTMFTKKPQTMAVAGIPENDDEKLKVALEILKKNVPDLADKLLKLADMSVNESIKFQMLIKML
jgi:hypothetical protein